MLQKRLSKTNHHMFHVLLVVIALLLLLSVIVWFLFFRSSDPTKNYNPKYSVNSSTVQNTNSGGTSQTENNDKNTSSDGTATSITSDQVPVASSGSVNIVDLEQASGYINAKATVTDFAATQCVYSFTAQDARPVVRQLNGSCDGISIPQGEFELIGKYTLTVTAYSGTSEKISAVKDIDVR